MIKRIVIALIGLVVTYPVYSELYNRSPCVEFVGSGHITPSPVPQNGKITIHWSVRELRECDGIVKRWIVGPEGRVYPLDDAPSVLHRLRPGVVNAIRTIDLPFGIPPGPAVYHAVVYRWSTKNFIASAIQRYFWPIVDERPGIPFEVRSP